MTVRLAAKRTGTPFGWLRGIAPMSPGQWIARCWASDRNRAVLWIPVAQATGIGLFFLQPEDPGLVPTLAAGALMTAMVLACVRAGVLAGVVGAILIACTVGLCSVPVRMALVKAPVVGGEGRAVTLTGVVERRERIGSGRVRLLMTDLHVSGLDAEDTPHRIRLSTHGSQVAGVRAGDSLRIRSVLSPPPGPIAPGAFDFSRRAWFAGIGGVGYAISDAIVLPPGEPGLTGDAQSAIERLRETIASRLIEQMGEHSGGVAAALLTGKRGAIGERVLDSIRDAGLAHLLAISGLHMALVCGTVFWTAGFLFAATPWIGVRITVKKWAAATALVAGAAYFLISGGSIATERAFIMVAVSLVAVLLDRPAITMRNLAIAAVAVLLARPEALLDAGFQMSFGAVAALVAFYDSLRSWRPERTEAERGPGLRLLRAVCLSVLAIAATTVVATMATGPIAAAHFNRIAVYGLAANMVAVPLVGMAIMPLGLLTLAMMPFGLDPYPAYVLGMAISFLLDVAETVSGLEGAVRMVATPPPPALALFAVGGLWLCLWRRSWKFAGLVPMSLAAVLALEPDRPDILVSRGMENMVVRGESGRLIAALPRKDRYSIEQWLRRDGDDAERDVSERSRLACDSEACVGRTATGQTVSFIMRRSALHEDCRRADILISRVLVPHHCKTPSLIIDFLDVRAKGPHAIHLGDGTTARPVRVRTVAEEQGDWPWSAHFRNRPR